MQNYLEELCDELNDAVVDGDAEARYLRSYAAAKRLAEAILVNKARVRFLWTMLSDSSRLVLGLAMLDHFYREEGNADAAL